MIDLGDTLPLTTEVTDAAGALTAASGVVCTIGLPDGTLATPAVTSPSVGRYTVDYVPVQAGRHTERWTSTAPATARSDTFDVRPAAPGYVISLADTKTHLRIGAADTSHDEQLRGFIEAATAVVEGYRNETIARRSITEFHTARGAYQLALRSSPAISLTSVARVDGLVTWDVAKLHLAPDTGLVTILPGADFLWGLLPGTGYFWGYLGVTYVAGYQVVPPNVALAAKFIVEHLWESQQQTGLGPRGPFGNPDDVGPTGSGYAVPNRALELLGGKSPGFG